MHASPSRKLRNTRNAAAITALLAAACAVSGCMVQAGTTTITNVSVDGHRVDATRSFVADGVGEFDCIRSSSGRCHYLLFVEDCAAGGKPAATTRCATRIVKTFTLQAGTSRRLTALPPHLRQCVGHDAAPVAPDCTGKRG